MGNIDIDPLFTKGPYGDFYLSQIDAGQGQTSPCVDAGEDDSSPVNRFNKDWTTNRTDGLFDTNRIDMGYHYPSHVQFDLDVNAGDVFQFRIQRQTGLLNDVEIPSRGGAWNMDVLKLLT